MDENNPENIKSEFLGAGKKTIIDGRDGEIISCIRGKLNKGIGCDLFDIEGTLGIDFAYTNIPIREKGIATRLLN